MHDITEDEIETAQLVLLDLKSEGYFGQEGHGEYRSCLPEFVRRAKEVDPGLSLMRCKSLYQQYRTRIERGEIRD